MGVTLPTDDPKLGGFALKDVQKALQLCLRHRNSFGLFNSEVFLADRRERGAMQRELDDRGFFAPDDDRRSMAVLSRDGNALAHGKKRRYPLSKAKEQIDGLLSRIEAHNASGRQLFLIDQVWLFGSVMREQETVGDIDIRYTTKRNPKFAGDEAYRRQKRILMQEVPSSLDYYDALDWHQKKCINGNRRHPLMAGVVEGPRDLIDLGVPCQKLYDMELGGRVNEPVQPRHPESKGRAEHIEPPLEMPDISACRAAPRPLHVDWLTGRRRDGWVAMNKAVKGLSLEHRSRRILTFDNTPEPQDENVDLSPFDGVSMFAMKGNDWQGEGIRVERSITAKDDGYVLKAKVRAPVLDEVPTSLRPDTFGLGQLLAVVLSGDALHITKRMEDQGRKPIIWIDVEFVGFESRLSNCMEQGFDTTVSGHDLFGFTKKECVSIEWDRLPAPRPDAPEPDLPELKLA